MANYLFSGSVVGNRYRIDLQERNSCGWGPIVPHPLEVIDCSGGVDPFRVGTNRVASQTAAYPNPADQELTLEQGGGPVTLTDAQGRPVRSQTAEPGRVLLDTHQLPAGLYFLETRDAASQPVRQQIRVTH
ncbi:T9SS type A sorting domain-containing protein [Hymenobacter psoromatis]|uniref:T9SS type A sorting domain-containing protein n=1 Tax=Hymenobacter psoromatis TaxID=1484116 RepID=UPI001CBAC66C|nr:T9SS type A sorting domain-containing protein [Hymenobacter psoromatis]